jgi:hypothetical protein
MDSGQYDSETGENTARRQKRWRLEQERRIAELETFAAERDPVNTGHDGGIASQANRNEPDWRGYATGRIVRQFATNETASDTEIYIWLTRHWTFPERECPGRSVCMALIKHLRETGQLLPNPRGRKKI